MTATLNAMEKNGCPICGYKYVDVLDEGGSAAFDICDSCGNECGLEYVPNSSQKHLEKLGRKWVIEQNCQWYGDICDIPKNWDPYKQMKLAGIKIPN